jgi:hypothetical protein
MSDYAQMEEQLLAANAYILTLGGTLPAPPLAGPPQVVDVPVITGNGIVGETLNCTWVTGRASRPAIIPMEE